MLYLLKPNTFRALLEYTTAPTRVYFLEILKEATNLFTKSRQRLKFPLPEDSMLPEASMTNARSILPWQTIEQTRRKTMNICYIVVAGVSVKYEVGVQL